MIKKKALWKDIFRSFKHSKGRFISILLLMMISSFALVGLKVTGPDMRETGKTYFSELNMADITVIGSYGLDDSDQKAIGKTAGVRQIDYGYFKDVTKKNSTESFRIFSKTKDVSTYQIEKGHLPQKDNEIALDAKYVEEYKLGDTIRFSEKADSTNSKRLKKDRFKIVGFVDSPEVISSLNRGQSTAGTGELDGFGIVNSANFDSPYYMIARMTFNDTRNLNPYTDDYKEKVQKHKDDLDEQLKEQPAARLTAIKAEYQTKVSDEKKQLTDARAQLSDGQSQLEAVREQLTAARQELEMQKQKAAQTDYVPEQLKAQLLASEQELVQKEADYQNQRKQFDVKKEEVQKKLMTGESQIADAQKTLDQLKQPVYLVNSRREAPGSEGYKIYNSISTIVDALANVFPVFLFLVAALVTFTTMGRFVDEERKNSGALKALGYTDKDIYKKFVVYGLSSSMAGTIIGIILGHTLLPLIVYNTYHEGFTIPKIQLEFHWEISVIACVLAFISAVIPALLSAKKELRERPADLLLPKAPAQGSRILLERIPFIWNRLSFTHKVTARNLFRYKKRMLMTIFGVAGSVALLFAGFSVQHSIEGINERQFGELIRYDMIVAESDILTPAQKNAIQQQLTDPTVKEYASVHYETVTKTAGAAGDTQEIKLIVPEKTQNFSDYIQLNDRKTKKELQLKDDGVIITERLAKLLKAEVGDEIKVKDAENQKRTVKVEGITEMYMGHFMFMNQNEYQSVFKQDFHSNASLVNLKDASEKNTKEQAAKFIDLAGVVGVVQNTTMTSQITMIVNSLNKIMEVLVLVAVLLAVVILYNLTNINVSERIRELSTIKVLGFFDKEVTLYIYRETMLLTAIGILFGFGLGEWLHQFILTAVPPNDVMFNPALSSISFIVPTIIIVVVTIILGFIINHRLKTIDMLEALKSVD
ncbi:FtsX-like permease family protein [Enterococcus sp. DIV0756]|uniref:ABC transporter permease n=1 Tax=Enterococcus sp. DIV0756 TaxID=2774636 RepID=UPI003F1E9291